jgi:hypothetical protein
MKICINKGYSEVGLGKHLFQLHRRHGVREGGALLMLHSNTALEYAVKNSDITEASRDWMVCTSASSL